MFEQAYSGTLIKGYQNVHIAMLIFFPTSIRAK